MTTETTDTTVNDVPTGTVGNQEPAAGIAGDAGNTAAQVVTFTTGQQAHIDKVIADRLKRERDKQQAALDKAKADAEAAALADEGKFKDLWEKEKAEKQTAIDRLAQMEFDQQRRDAAQAAGIGQLWQRLQGSTPEELAEDAKALAAMMQPAQPANGQARQGTIPTPPPQGTAGMTPEERRARARPTF